MTTDDYEDDRSQDERDRAGGRTPDDIEREIEQTRADMDETLDAIQNRFSPRGMMDQVLDYVRVGPGEFGENLMSTVRANPIPVALIGVGLTWLLVSSTRSSGMSYASDDDDYTYRTAGGRQVRGGKETGSMPAMGEHSHVHGIGSRLSGAAGAVRDRAASAVSGVQSAAGSLAEGAGEWVSTARGGLGEGSDLARRQIQRARQRFDDTLEEQPLLLGLLGLGVGVLVGLALPGTRREDELMGPARDALRRRAEELGREELDRARRVAGRTLEAARDEATDLARFAAEDIARTATETAREAASEENLGASVRGGGRSRSRSSSTE